MFSQAGTKPLHVVVVDDERPILDCACLDGRNAVRSCPACLRMALKLWIFA